MEYIIKIITLENCEFSKKSLKLLNKNNIDYKLIKIKYNEKEKFKTNKINTYPQIYLTKQNDKGHLLLGGYDKLNNFINIFKNKNNSNKELFLKNKEQFINENPEWSNKAVLRLIQLVYNNKI